MWPFPYKTITEQARDEKEWQVQVREETVRKVRKQIEHELDEKIRKAEHMYSRRNKIEEVFNTAIVALYDNDQEHLADHLTELFGAAVHDLKTYTEKQDGTKGT